METLQSYPSRKCQDHSKHGPSISLHNYNDPLLSTASNLLSPTRLHHGHQPQQTYIPPESLPIIPIAFLIILIPVYDRKNHRHSHRNYPLAAHRSWSNTLFHLNGRGCRVKRKKVTREHNMLDAIPPFEPLPISVFWLSFQYFIFGIADMFTYVGLLEFFYSEAPKGLKSTSTCFLWTSMALGYFLSTIVVKSVNGIKIERE